MMTLQISQAANEEIENAARLAVDARNLAQNAACVACNGNAGQITRGLRHRRSFGNMATRAFRYGLQQHRAKYTSVWSQDLLVDFWLQLAADAEDLAQQLGASASTHADARNMQLANYGKDHDADWARECRIERRIS